jgi:hypothetical protein
MSEPDSSRVGVAGGRVAAGERGPSDAAEARRTADPDHEATLRSGEIESAPVNSDDHAKAPALPTSGGSSEA